MMSENLIAVESGGEKAPYLLVSVTPDLSLQELCSLLVRCEKAQRRYQWTSGLILTTLMNDPNTPKKAAEFVRWLETQTGMVLSQNEVGRRLAVYKFYSRLPDTGIVELIERGGSHVAHRAMKVISLQPDCARAVLEACVNNPDGIDDTLRSFGAKPKVSRAKARKPEFESEPPTTPKFDMRLSLADHIKNMRGREWVPLEVVLEMLAAFQAPRNEN